MTTVGALVVGFVLGRVVCNVLVAAWRESTRLIRDRELNELVRRVRRERADETAIRRALAGRVWAG
jgi:hypothetical protein